MSLDSSETGRQNIFHLIHKSCIPESTLNTPKCQTVSSLSKGRVKSQGLKTRDTITADMQSWDKNTIEKKPSGC
jgi:hypothetical protein